MGYLIIVHVESGDEVKRVIQAAEDLPGHIGTAGVYRMPPTDEPTCMGLSGGCRETGWKRDPRGHMVHACGKRNRNYRDTLAVGLMDTFGRNLLPRKRTPAVFRNPN